MTSHRKFPRASKLSTSKLSTSKLRAGRPSKLTMTVACSTVLAAGAAAGTAVAWPGPASARPAGGISDETVAGAGPAARGAAAGRAAASQIAAGPAGPGLALATYKGQQSESFASAAAAAARAGAARLAAQRQAVRAAQAALSAPQAAASTSPRAAAAPAAPPAAVTPGSAQQIAMSMLGSYGWASSQFSCLNDLWSRESGWRTTAENPSGAYGIPQALPGSKMASAGADWPTSASTQIRWGLGYIKGQYGSPCGAWSHEEATGWY